MDALLQNAIIFSSAHLASSQIPIQTDREVTSRIEEIARAHTHDEVSCDSCIARDQGHYHINSWRVPVLLSVLSRWDREYTIAENRAHLANNVGSQTNPMATVNARNACSSALGSAIVPRQRM